MLRVFCFGKELVALTLVALGLVAIGGCPMADDSGTASNGTGSASTGASSTGGSTRPVPTGVPKGGRWRIETDTNIFPATADLFSFGFDDVGDWQYSELIFNQEGRVTQVSQYSPTYGTMTFTIDSAWHTANIPGSATERYIGRIDVSEQPGGRIQFTFYAAARSFRGQGSQLFGVNRTSVSVAWVDADRLAAPQGTVITTTDAVDFDITEPDLPSRFTDPALWSAPDNQTRSLAFRWGLRRVGG